MKNEIIEKIRTILAGPAIGESQVTHLFALIRKMLEGLSRPERDQYQLLGFYCDWALHTRIDRSEQGAAILERVHQVVIDHMTKKDSSTMPNDLSAVLSFDTLGIQLNEFLRLYADGQKIEETDWVGIIPILAEIISSCPVTISPKRGGALKQFMDRIRLQPIKDGSVVEEIAIVKISSAVFFPNQTPITETFCLKLTLSDTTKIIAPIMRPTR